MQILDFNTPIPSEETPIDHCESNGLCHIQFPDILFGREREKKELTETLDSVCNGSSALTFISGSAGTGKTALVKSVNEEAAKAGALFAAGKPDQYSPDIPYNAFAQIVKAITKHLLMFSDYALAVLKKQITETLNEDICLLSDIVPELEYITGPGKKIAVPDSSNAENRFKRALSGFLKIIAAQSRGLVIFLDDMQWADSATIKTIKYIIEEDISGLYIIEAYRDNEVNENHPLAEMISEASRSSRALHLIRLNELDSESVEKIITTALKDNSNKIKKLALYVFNKTAGNPFYVRKFMQSLFLQGYLNYENTIWKWDEYKSKTIPASDNVLTLIADMIGTLADNEQEILRTASCIGNRFSIELLSMITEIRHSKLTNILSRLVKNNYLITTDDLDIYAFSHDRIQEAAYGLLSAKEKSELHWKTGDMLTRLYGTGSEYIFEITDHLNRANETEIDISKLAKLNLRAGIKAKTNFAYEAAISYLEKSKCLYGNAGNKDSDLIYTISKNYCECLYLNAEYEKAEKAVFEAMKLTGDATEKADLYNILIVIKTLQSRYKEGMDIGLNALSIFGIEFEHDTALREKQIKEVRDSLNPRLNKITPEDILNMPVCKQPDIQRIAVLLKNTSAAAYHSGDWTLCYLLHARTVSLTLKHGLVADSPEGFVGYALVIIVLWNEYNLGYKLGDAAWKLCHKYKDLSQMCDVSVHFGCYVLFWKRHLKHSIDILKTGLDAGIKSGEYLFVGYSLNHILYNKFNTGNELKTLLKDLDEKIILMLKLKNELIYENLIVLKIILHNMTGKTKNKESFDLADLKEEDLIKKFNDKKLFLCYAIYSFYKSFSLYIYGNYEESLLSLNLVREHSNNILGTFHLIDYHFYLALNLTALASGDKECYRLLAEPRAKFKELASECPENFLCRHLLIEAECAKLDKDFMSAMSLYDRAIASARENEYIQIEGIACERAAQFWLSLGKEDFAALYLKRAYDRFGKWGAVRKLECLRKDYPKILHEHTELELMSGTDILTLLKHFNELSENLDLNTLLKTLSGIMLNNSGADLFALVIEQDDKMLVQALGTPESEKAAIMKALPLEKFEKDSEPALPVEMLRYIKRTGDTIINYDGHPESIFYNTPYIKKNKPCSAVCLRTDAGRYKVIMYLENKSISGAFTGVKKTLLELLSKQAAICIQNAIYIQEHNNAIKKTAFTFKAAGEIKTLPYKKILYFSSNGRHTTVHTASEKYNILMLLKDIENELPTDLFIRIHKQYIINKNNITCFKRNTGGRYKIFLNDDDYTSFLVGRAYYPAVKEKLKV